MINSLEVVHRFMGLMLDTVNWEGFKEMSYEVFPFDLFDERLRARIARVHDLVFKEFNISWKYSILKTTDSAYQAYRRDLEASPYDD